MAVRTHVSGSAISARIRFYTLLKTGVSLNLQPNLLPTSKWMRLGRAQYPCLHKLRFHSMNKSPENILTDSLRTLKLKSTAKPALTQREVNGALYCYSRELQLDERKLTS